MQMKDASKCAPPPSYGVLVPSIFIATQTLNYNMRCRVYNFVSRNKPLASCTPSVTMCQLLVTLSVIRSRRIIKTRCTWRLRFVPTVMNLDPIVYRLVDLWCTYQLWSVITVRKDVIANNKHGESLESVPTLTVFFIWWLPLVMVSGPQGEILPSI